MIQKEIWANNIYAQHALTGKSAEYEAGTFPNSVSNDEHLKSYPVLEVQGGNSYVV